MKQLVMCTDCPRQELCKQSSVNYCWEYVERMAELEAKS